MENKCIAITGNTGKTTFSFYLAQLLSSIGKRVIMVSTDDRCPPYGILFPQHRKKEAVVKSLGKLMSLPLITQSDIFQHARKINNNFFLLCYDEKETKLNYATIGESNTTKLIEELEIIADVILIDTTSYENKLDQYILAKGIPRIVITSADQKGFYYRDIFPVGKWNLYLEISKYNSLQDVKASFKSPDSALCLPFSKNLQALYNGMDITDIAPNNEYRKILTKIAGEIL